MQKKNIIIPLLLILVPFIAYGQEKKQNILLSTDIAEIQEYLKATHPDDPKKIVLKSRLIDLKNKAWTKNAQYVKPMAVRSWTGESSINPNEQEEFKKLMTESSTEHKEKTVRLLNSLFNNDPASREVILLLRNNSKCNIIFRMQGKKLYNLAIPAGGENFMVINKDLYQIRTSICESLYNREKDLKKSIILELGSSGKDQFRNL